MPFFDPIRIGASAGGTASYEVARSLRFERGDSAYLARTAGSPTNSNKFSFSCWVKRTQLSTSSLTMMGGGGGSQTNSNAEALLYFVGTDEIASNYKGGLASCTVGWFMKATRKLRDTTSWYHLLSVWDGTQSGDPNRMKFFVNGIQEALGHDCGSTAAGFQYVNQNGETQYIGRMDAGGGPNYSSFYLAEAYFVDGTACTPSDFIETDSRTGQIIPKNSDDVLGALTMGNNGFYLNFSDNSDVTSTTLGKDNSGNNNNWTPYNFSVSAGVNNDSVEDTPTNNFCTLNPLDTWRDNSSTSDGNLKFIRSASNFGGGRATMAVKSGKWYFEFTKGSGLVQAGFANTDFNINYNSGDVSLTSSGANACGLAYDSRGFWYGYTGSSPSSISDDDIIGVAFDADNFKFYFHKNGTYYGSGNPSTGSNGITPNHSNQVSKTDDMFFAPYFNAENGNGYANFGQRPFSHTIPTGYKTLCSANLPNPTILLSNKYFDTSLYTGNGSTGQSISTLQFQPDWLWFKTRSDTRNHAVNDSVRGRAKGSYPDDSSAEFTDDAGRGLASFNANGFTVGEPQNASSHNKSGETIVAWGWDAGETDSKTYTVKVVSDSGNKYRFDDFGTSAVTLDLAEGGTYVFDWSDSSAQSHPIRFSTTSDGTHGGGSEYTTGVVKDDSAYKTTITVAASAPTLYYYCQNHSGMGGQVNTNSTLGSSNFDGAIQSTVKVNTTAGFSIVSYTGSGSITTAGHGLGVAPVMSIRKARNASLDWFVHHTLVDGSMDFLKLNSSTSNSNSSLSAFTSTVFPVDNNTNQYIIYCFSSVEGFSKFGSYVGNGSSSNGTYVYLGFKPALIIYKKTNNSDNWEMHDSKRNTFNPVTRQLFPNNNNTESTSTNVDFLANGFKHYNANGNTNENGDTYIYFAWAESPFKNSRAR